VILSSKKEALSRGANFGGKAGPRLARKALLAAKFGKGLPLLCLGFPKYIPVFHLSQFQRSLLPIRRDYTCLSTESDDFLNFDQIKRFQGAF
jgi:hypothetical protein